MLAGARLGAVRVELGVLVERDGVVRVRVAEDVAAVAAVVAPFEEGEGFLADGRVADGRVRVGFPVGARGYAGDVGEGEGREDGGLGGFDGATGGYVAFAVADGGVRGRGGRVGGEGRGGVLEAVRAAVHAPRWRERGGTRGPLGGSQDGGDVHGRLGGSQLARGDGEVGEHVRVARRRWGEVHRGVGRGVGGGDLLGAIEVDLRVGRGGEGLGAVGDVEHDEAASPRT